MPDAPGPPLDIRRPFSRADAIAAGIDPKLLRGSRFRRIFRGVLVDTSAPTTPELRVQAALVPFPASAYASHASAARVHRLPIPILPDEHVTVVDPDHAGPVRASAATWRGAASCAQTYVELADALSLVDLVIVGDNLVRKGRVTPEELVRFSSTSSLPGARCALTAAR